MATRKPKPNPNPKPNPMPNPKPIPKPNPIPTRIPPSPPIPKLLPLPPRASRALAHCAGPDSSSSTVSAIATAFFARATRASSCLIF